MSSNVIQLNATQLAEEQAEINELLQALLGVYSDLHNHATVIVEAIEEGQDLLASIGPETGTDETLRLLNEASIYFHNLRARVVCFAAGADDDDNPEMMVRH